MYSPTIAEALIPSLYRLARRRSTPMTALVSEALTEYLARQSDGQEFLPRDVPAPRRPGVAAPRAVPNDAVRGASHRA